MCNTVYNMIQEKKRKKRKQQQKKAHLPLNFGNTVAVSEFKMQFQLPAQNLLTWTI